MARKAVGLDLLRSAFILLCKLLLVDVVCSFVGSWLCYFLLMRKTLAPPNSKRSHGEYDNNGIQVIICGLPRSGSTSLREAMNILGFPCFHGAHLFKPSTANLFIKAKLSGTHKDWNKLLRGYKSIADNPAASSYRELIDFYPNAKVILNIRDPERWYASYSQTIVKFKQSLIFQVVQSPIERTGKLTFFKPGSNGLNITSYKQHVEDVKRHVPAHRLCIFDLEENEGWDPLCKFLGVPIPSVPFPSMNQADIFSKRIQYHKTIHSIVLFSYLAILLTIIMSSCKWVLSM